MQIFFSATNHIVDYQPLKVNILFPYHLLLMPRLCAINICSANSYHLVVVNINYFKGITMALTTDIGTIT